MLIPVLLTLLVVLFRVVLGYTGMHDYPQLQWAHNFSPLAAVALCGAAFFPRRLAFLLPLGALLGSDLALNAIYGVRLIGLWMLPQYLALALAGGLGFALRGRARLGTMLGASVAGSVLFYLLTNTGAWLANPAYAHNAAGWVQALTVGDPHFTPALLFFRNSLVSDLLFTALFVLVTVPRPAGREASALAPGAA